MHCVFIDMHKWKNFHSNIIGGISTVVNTDQQKDHYYNSVLVEECVRGSYKKARYYVTLDVFMERGRSSL